VIHSRRISVPSRGRWSEEDAILASFDVAVISSYFPDFERELPSYLERG
jgi:hypothetical protein